MQFFLNDLKLKKKSPASKKYNKYTRYPHYPGTKIKENRPRQKPYIVFSSFCCGCKLILDKCQSLRLLFFCFFCGLSIEETRTPVLFTKRPFPLTLGNYYRVMRCALLRISFLSFFFFGFFCLSPYK